MSENDPATLGAVLDRLSAVIAARRGAAPSESYTAALLAEGPAKCARKFGEEAVETICCCDFGIALC